MFRKIAISSLVLASVEGTDFSWPEYKASFHKVYASSSDEATARAHFVENRAKIAAHNALDLPYKQGLNQFSDRSRAAWRNQFRHDMSGRGNPAQKQLASSLGRDGHDCIESQAVSAAHVASLPASVDWVAAGNRVSPVMDQGNCGACWAFSTVATIEGSLGMGGHDLEVLSPEDISACTRGQGNAGCNGGNDWVALPWIGVHGIASLADSPFVDGKSGVTSSCDAARKPAVNITSCHSIYDNLGSLQAAVAVQPVSGNIEVVDDLMEYTSGIYTGKGDGPGTEGPCDNTTSAGVNHAVTFVGYGTTSDGTDYWLMKNSWGAQWGEKGFFRMLRGQNICGIETYATTADGAHPI